MLLGGCIDLGVLGGRLDGGAQVDGSVDSDAAVTMHDLAGSPDTQLPPDCKPGTRVSITPTSSTFHTSLPIEIASLTDGLFWFAGVDDGNGSNVSSTPLYTGTFKLGDAAVGRFAAVSTVNGQTITGGLRARISRTVSKTERLPLVFWMTTDTKAQFVTAPWPTDAQPLAFSSSNAVACPSSGILGNAVDIAAFGTDPIVAEVCGTTGAYVRGSTPFASFAPASDVRVVEYAPDSAVGVFTPDASSPVRRSFFALDKTTNTPSSAVVYADVPIDITSGLAIDARHPDLSSASTQVLIAGFSATGALEATVVDTASASAQPASLQLVTQSTSLGVAGSNTHFVLVYEDSGDVLARFEYGIAHQWTQPVTIAKQATNPRVAADRASGTFVVSYLASGATPALVEVTCQ